MLEIHHSGREPSKFCYLEINGCGLNPTHTLSVMVRNQSIMPLSLGEAMSVYRYILYSNSNAHQNLNMKRTYSKENGHKRFNNRLNDIFVVESVGEDL